MRIQANAQTQMGTWGVMLTGWEGVEPRTPSFQQWLSRDEAAELVGRIAHALLPNGVAEPTEKT